jgi:K+-transporting ATPase ATPase C chain
MLKELRISVVAIVLLTVMLGLAYPLVVTGISQVAFKNKANGSFITRDGKVVGSKLIATGVKSPGLFHPRPSATGYSATATFFANRGPNDSAARYFHRDQIKAYLALNARYNPGLVAGTIPIDAVTASASGVDPQISEANARIQARRVAAVDKLPLAKVIQLVKDNTDGRFLGLIGEPGVNITEVNLAIQDATR